MIVDFDQTDGSSPSQASVCVIGAGAAGIALALELARLGMSVTLLESGGLEQEEGTQALCAGEVTGLPHDGIHAGRFRVLGGTTTQWGGQILELDQQDFEVRSWIPGSGWPFSKAALAPYYQRALDIEGLTAALRDDESVWQAIRTPQPALGDALVPFFTRWCPEPNFAQLFRSDLRDESRITVFLHANACEILLADGRESIAGERCRSLGGRSATFTADQYVFCLGGIETARILLQPLSGGRTAPWNSSGLTGRFFQDHIDSTLIEVLPRQRRQLHRWFDNVYRSGFKYQPKLKLSATEQARLQCLGIGASFVFLSEKSKILSEFREMAGQLRRGLVSPMELARQIRHLRVRSLSDAGLFIRQALRFKLQGRAYNPDDAGIFLRVHCEQAPNADSRVTLTTERDAIGMLQCRLDWRVTDLEVETVRHFSRVIHESFTSCGFADIRPHPGVEEGGLELLSRFDDSYHHMGATRMASSPRAGVVDPDLRLFGIRNGYVCSSSVFPTSGFSNPTHTLIAFGGTPGGTFDGGRVS